MPLPDSFDLHIHVHLDPGGPSVLASLSPVLAKLGASIVSQLSDSIAAASKSADDAIARVQADVTTLTEKVAALQAQVDQGTASPADIQALSDLKTKLDALDPTKPDVIPDQPADNGGIPA
jgi:hypothetical protein